MKIWFLEIIFFPLCMALYDEHFENKYQSPELVANVIFKNNNFFSCFFNP